MKFGISTEGISGSSLQSDLDGINLVAPDYYFDSVYGGEVLRRRARECARSFFFADNGIPPEFLFIIS